VTDLAREVYLRPPRGGLCFGAQGSTLSGPRQKEEGTMKHFLIKYRFGNGSEEDWHREIKRFIAAIESDPALNGRISYRCLKANNGSGDCYHLAAAEDDEAAKALQERDFFKRYTGESKRVSGGSLEVVPLAIIAETAFRP
jgi:hypothetical protein